MVKAKKKKKRVKKKVSQDMFVSGGLNLFMIGGVIAVFYQALYFLITAEPSTEEVSYALFWKIFEELGMLSLFFGLILVCYSFLKEVGFFKKYAGSFLISGALLSLAAAFYAVYSHISGLTEQTITLRSFVLATFPQLMNNVSRIYLYLGILFLGIFLWGYRERRKWSAGFLVGGVVLACVALVMTMYTTYENYTVFIGMYGEAGKGYLISQVLFPDLLRSISLLLVLIGVLFFAASYLWTFRVRKWAGRMWLFGGAAGAFYGFIRLGIDSQMIRNEITSVRQSIMDLTPYTTSLKDQMLTVETLREFYVKKVIPLYFEHSLWIIFLTGIAFIGLYLWMRE